MSAKPPSESLSTAAPAATSSVPFTKSGKVSSTTVAPLSTSRRPTTSACASTAAANGVPAGMRTESATVGTAPPLQLDATLQFALVAPVQVMFASVAVAVAVATACAVGAVVIVAVMLCVPSSAPSVQAVANRPFASVTPPTGETLPSPTVIATVTGAPAATLPNWSVTPNAIESTSGASTVAACASPLSTAICVGAAAPMLNAALLAPASPGDVAASTQLLAPRSTVRSANVATPATAFTVVVPPSTAVGGPFVNATVIAPVKLATGLPRPSRASITHPGVIGVPAVPAPVLSVNTSCDAVPAVAVAVKSCGEPVSPPAVACTVAVPGTDGSVSVVLADPPASVAVVVALNAPPAEVIAQSTAKPDTPFPKLSITRTTNGAASAVITAPDCALPDTVVSCAAAALSTVMPLVVSAGSAPLDAVNRKPVPARVMATALNVTRPSTASAVSVPIGVVGPAGDAASTMVIESEKVVTVAPTASTTWKTTGSASGTPATCSESGWPKSWSRAAAPATPVAVRLALNPPVTSARAVCAPANGPSTHRAFAWPFASLSTLAGEMLAPALTVAKVTVAPATAFVKASRTSTVIESASGWPSVPVCAFPEITVIDAGAAAEIANAALVSGVSAPLVAENVRPAEARWMLRSAKVAIPATALTVAVPPSVAPVAPALSASVTGPVKSGVSTLFTSRTSTTTDASVAPAIPAGGAAVIASCVGRGARPVAVTTCVAPAIPVAVAVTDCAPTTEPRVHDVETSPVASDVSATEASDPPPVVTAKLTGMPATGTESVAVTRNTSGCASVVPITADCAPPETASSREAGSETTKNEVSARRFSVDAMIRTLPRFGSHVTVPLPGAANVARDAVSAEKPIGVPGIGAPPPSNAVAENTVVVPATPVPVVGVITTEAGTAPGGTHATGISIGALAVEPEGRALIAAGPPLKTVSPAAFTKAIASVSGSPESETVNGNGTLSVSATESAVDGKSTTVSFTTAPSSPRSVTRTRTNGTRSLAKFVPGSCGNCGSIASAATRLSPNGKPSPGPVTSRPQERSERPKMPVRRRTRRLLRVTAVGLGWGSALR